MIKHLDNQTFYKALESYVGSKIPRDDWKRMRDMALRGANVLLGDYSQLTGSDKRDYVEPWGSIKFCFGDKLATEYICQREAGKQLFTHLWNAGIQKDMTLSGITAATSSITSATDAINSVATASKAVSNTINTTDLWSNIADSTSVRIEHPVYQSDFEPVRTKVNKTAEELKAATEIYQTRLNDVEREISNLWNKTNADYAVLNDKTNSLDERERSLADTVDWTINERFIDLAADTIDLKEAVKLLKERVEQLGRNLEVHLTPIDGEEAKCEDYKEDIMNTNSMFNFDFGRVTDSVRVSTYGLAIKGVDGRYVSWDNKNKSVMDVEVLSMPGSEFVYKMPVAIKDVKVGDVVVHNRVPMYVTAVNAQTLTVVDIREATEKTIYPVKSPFGFNFVTKVVSLFDSVNGTASADAPFGNMLPFMLMGNKDMDPMMLMMMMGQGSNTNMMSNPMMMYFLMKDGKGSDMLPFVMMGMMNQPVSTPATAPQTPNE
jgi:hypothetical protein